MHKGKGMLAGLLWYAMQSAVAGEVQVEQAELTLQDGRWRADVTLRHADSGWEHYADAWRLVDGNGTVLATRKLWHPHVDEQPFTRSQGDIEIPDAVRFVYVEGHDKVHGWSSDRIEVDLLQAQGERYRIRR